MARTPEPSGTRSTHIDVVGRNFDIWVDEAQIMRNGQFLLEA